MSLHRPLLAALPALLALGLSACGGGFYVSDGFDDDDPEVTLSTDADTVAPGQTLRLVAEADDDFGVRRVSFYRVTSGTRVLLATDTTRPYEVDFRVPDTASGTLTFVARVSDFVGQIGQSDAVEVAVVR